jgi:hypothetical protein
MLTREEIENALPGRSLDRLVAPLAGWTYKRSIGRWVEPGGGMAHVNPPAFSLEIAAAWQLVEKLTIDGWGHRHTVYSPAAERPGWSWEFVIGRKRIEAMEETAPLAICKAALLVHLEAVSPTPHS